MVCLSQGTPSGAQLLIQASELRPKALISLYPEIERVLFGAVAAAALGVCG